MIQAFVGSKTACAPAGVMNVTVTGSWLGGTLDIQRGTTSKEKLSLSLGGTQRWTSKQHGRQDILLQPSSKIIAFSSRQGAGVKVKLSRITVNVVQQRNGEFLHLLVSDLEHVSKKFDIGGLLGAQQTSVVGMDSNATDGSRLVLEKTL